MATTLQDYRNETRRVLHDAQATYWDDASIDSYINRAIKQRDRDSGMNRQVKNFNLIAGTVEYLLTTVEATAIDVIGIVLIFGNYRYQLRQEPWNTVGSIYQPYQGYQQVPVAFAKVGSNKIRFAPIPNQAFVTEWDLLQVAVDLVNPTDQDPLLYPWTDPVPYKAAAFAKLELQQFPEADQMHQLYAARMTEVIAGARGMMIQNPYAIQPTTGITR